MFLCIFFFTAVVFIGVCYPNTAFSWKGRWVTITGTQFRSPKDTSASCDYRRSDVICVLKAFGVIWRFVSELITVLSNRSVLKTYRGLFSHQIIRFIILSEEDISFAQIFSGNYES